MPQFLQSNITILRKHNKNLPADERNETDHNLQRNNYFINLGEANEFSNHNIIDTITQKISRFSRFNCCSKARNTIFYKN